MDEQEQEPKEDRSPLILAIGMGLCLSWWRLCHENCFSGIHHAEVLGQLHDAALLLQSANCIANFLGIFAACLAVGLLARAKALPRPWIAALLIAAQLGITLATDVLGPSPTLALVVFLQFSCSALCFSVIFIALSCYRNMELSRVVRLFLVSLVAYGLIGIAARMPDFLFPGLISFAHPARVAFHLAVAAGAAFCCLSALLGVFGNTPSSLDRKSWRDPLPAGTKMPWPAAAFLASYALVFGASHALASGIATVADQMSLFAYLGLFIAGLTFYLLFRREERTRKIWPSVRQVIFPLAMLSFILLPFSKAWMALASIALAECASNAYFAFLFLAAFIAARKLKASPTTIIVRMGYVSAPALIVGVTLGSLLDARISHDAQLSCMIVAAAFILLVAGTFWVGDDRRVSLLWGLEKRLTPRRFEDTLMVARCDKVAEKFGLTKRERELLPLIAAGQTNAMIAEAAFISPNTVRTHITRIHRKTGTHSRHELVRLIESL